MRDHANATNTCELTTGTIAHRVLGPETGPAVVFVHGALVDSTLWQDVDHRLAERGFRTFAPDLPLGSHRIAMPDGADLTPRGQARLIIEYLAQNGLTDATLVANDSGGAITQLLLDTDASRVGRVVFTNCDTVDRFPPPPFNTMFKLARYPAVTKVLMQPMRSATMRRVAGYGPLCAKPVDPDLTRHWIEPARTDSRIRADFARFVRGVDSADLRGATGRLGEFGGPVLVAWAPEDRCFRIAEGRELASRFANSEVVEIPDCRTFVAHDQPARLAEEIVRFVGEPRMK